MKAKRAFPLEAALGDDELLVQAGVGGGHSAVWPSAGSLSPPSQINQYFEHVSSARLLVELLMYDFQQQQKVCS